MGIHESKKRVDAYAKVTGEAKYVSDLEPAGLLTAKIVHSTIANGLVKCFDLSEAQKVPGVVKIVTCFDVPDVQFPTPGHPWSVETAHQDVADRKLLNTRVRLYGDDIAAVIAENEIAANRAVKLIKVTYEEYPPVLTVHEAMQPNVLPLHEERPNNVLAHSTLSVGEGTFEEAFLTYAGEEHKALLDDRKEGVTEVADCVYLCKTYHTQRVQHCHIEPPVSFAYQDPNGKIVVTASTQIPHIVRRIIGQALNIPWGNIRVIKPYIGGGFGNKQDMLYEALNAYLCTQVHGRGVKLEISREETLSNTRVRHPIEFQVRALMKKDGTLLARDLVAYSNQGAYASHGHAIVANAMNMFKQLYRDQKVLTCEGYTVYTNTAAGGAMRGYGIPQSDFGTESMMDDLAYAIHMDPLEVRLKNCMQDGYEDPHTKVKFLSYGLQECIRKGKETIGWEKKRKEYQNQTGNLRRGVGMAIFCYKTGVYPISLETAAVRMVLNQDGSLQLQMGATEIGQGADTVFTQMAAEVLGITEDRIYIVSTQDTDVTPFDTGAYASRQTYVSGKALKKTGLLLKDKILDYASYLLKKDSSTLDIELNQIVDINTRVPLLSMTDLATESFYSLTRSEHITAEATYHCKENTFSSGACFAEIEADLSLGTIKVLNLVNVHDSGTLINPQLAEAQVHGGMSMGLGYALSEQLIYDKSGRPLNDNLLDYKLPTSMDTPDLCAQFVEIEDPSGPFGNKALGEPPAIPVAPAIRNALLHATNVAVDSLPLDPQKLIEHYKKAGLL